MNIKKKMKNKGFTLIELVVALSVGAVILVMLSISLVGINDILRDKNNASIKINDTSSIKSEINKICSEYELLNYNIQISSDKKSLIYSKNAENYIIKITDKWLTKNESKIKYYKSIDSLEFNNLENDIVCKINYIDKQALRFVI